MTDVTDTTDTRKADHAFPLDNTDPALAPHLMDTLVEMQATCPVAWSDAAGGFWALSKHADIVASSNDWQTYTVTQGITIPETGKSVRLVPAELDPPEHSHYRKFVLPHFTPKGLEKWRPQLEQIVADAWAPIRDDGHGDVATPVARRVPVDAICLILGIRADWTHISHLGEQFLATTGDVGNRHRAVEAAAELETILRAEIASRRGKPAEDLLGQFLHETVLGEPLTDDQALGLCVLLIIAGHGTTVDGIGTLVRRVLVEPGLRERVLADRSLVPKIVDESLRVDPPVWNMARTVAHETLMRGVTLCPGEKVMLAYGAANRDPERFDRPNEFDIDRAEPSGHLAFGSGRHRCIGEGLARLELSLVLEHMLDHLPDLELAGEVVWGGHMSTHGLVTVPVRVPNSGTES
jgi:cytochrome P450